ncbi:hypothetical protein M9435_002426 [Picochlorum sp. BPE23]|nr:hypothetical protein M9435_002426 [Picochlorum sp. BPE23]
MFCCAHLLTRGSSSQVRVVLGKQPGAGGNINTSRRVGIPFTATVRAFQSRRRVMEQTKAQFAEHMGMGGATEEEVKSTVQQYYGQELKTTEDLKTSACCTAKPPSPVVRDILKRVPDEVVAKYYGCGSPFPVGIGGLRVLDLGSGSGRDCYVCAGLVGESGSVVGVDMTREQLDVAEAYAETFCKETLGYAATNLRFVEGEIENLEKAGIEDNSIDLIISNCVVNLSPNKEAVLKEAYRVLAPGGEMFFSDVYCDRRLPAEARRHPVLVGECLGGALYEQDFLRLARSVGFTDPRMFAAPEVIEVKDTVLKDILGEATFYSITYRLFKLPDRLETLCEDYGQAARYKGTMEGAPHACVLDDHHVFETGKWYEVCGNTASMVGESWMGKHFEIIGDRSRHYGLFGGCGDAPSSTQKDTETGGGGCC